MSSAEDRFDPEIRTVLAEGPERAAALQAIAPDMTASREAWKAQLEAWRSVLPPFNGTDEERMVPGLPDNPDVKVRIYRENGAKYPEAVLVWVHGGGYVLGSSTSIMDGIPPESFVTMVKAVHKYGRYGSLGRDSESRRIS